MGTKWRQTKWRKTRWRETREKLEGLVNGPHRSIEWPLAICNLLNPWQPMLRSSMIAVPCGFCWSVWSSWTRKHHKLHTSCILFLQIISLGHHRIHCSRMTWLMVAMKIRLRPLLFYSWFLQPEQFILKQYPTHFLSCGFYVYMCNIQLQETVKLVQWNVSPTQQFSFFCNFSASWLEPMSDVTKERGDCGTLGALGMPRSITGWLGWRLPWAGTRRCGVRGAFDAIPIR